MAAILLVLVLTVLGVVLGEPDWLTPLIALSIMLVAVMFGARGGFVAALIASAGFIGWALGDGYEGSDVVNHHPLLFFTVGLLTGFYAHGLLGDYNLGRAMDRGRLRRGLRRGEIVLHYQPVAEAESGRVVEFEALARWEDPSRGTLMPDEFVPIAEDDPTTIWELTLYTLEHAIRECGGWQHRGLEVGVSVNLSSATIDHAGLSEEIGRFVTASDLDASQLTLEVTESAVMGEPHEVARALARVRAVNTTTIAIDDFGTGYSSLARLEQLPVDTLKIDQMFMRRSDEERRREMLQSIIDLAHGLKLTACAEGVEDQATWDALIDLGCDTVQGYALAKPMPAERVPMWLAESRKGAARGTGTARSDPT